MPITEEWRLVAGTSGYAVSNQGRVRSSRRRWRARLLRPTIRRSGGHGKEGTKYRRRVVGVVYPDLTRTVTVASLVCAAFHGPRLSGLMVRHLDGNSLNDHADNLAWGTAAQNSADAIRHGTHPWQVHRPTAERRKKRMPAKRWVVPGSLADQIATVLTDHPGGLRTAELSARVYPDPTEAGYPSRSKATMAVGNECKRLFNTGRLTRTQQRVGGRVRPITRYLLPPD